MDSRYITSIRRGRDGMNPQPLFAFWFGAGGAGR